MAACAMACISWVGHAQNSLDKQIIGKWCNPYTYQSTGELKGFHFQKGGKCSAINIPSLDLKTWKIEDGYLVIEGYSIEEGGKKEVYETHERIDKLTSDTLEVISQEANPRLAFLYLNTKSIKKLVTPQVNGKKK